VIYLWSVRVRLASRQHSIHTYKPNDNLVQARGFERLGGLCAPAGERALATQLAVVGRRVFRVVVSSFGRNQRLVLGLRHVVVSPLRYTVTSRDTKRNAFREVVEEDRKT
jgi:hypothetical protein